MKTVEITYKVNSLPNNREKLSPQINALIQAIEKCQKDNFVKRAEVFDAWSKMTSSTDNDKVFASHIHDLIQYDFLDKTTKVVDPKVNLAKLMKTMTKEEILAVLNQ